jgi:hypothetical protein
LHKNYSTVLTLQNFRVDSGEIEHNSKSLALTLVSLHAIAAVLLLLPPRARPDLAPGEGEREGGYLRGCRMEYKTSGRWCHRSDTKNGGDLMWSG